MGKIDRAEVGNFAIRCVHDIGVQLQLLVHVRDPAFAKAFPCHHRDGARAQHGPHRHFNRAGVGPRDDANAMRIGNLQHFAHKIDSALQA